MSLSNPRILFGVHSISPYSRFDASPYGILKVVGSANLSLASSVEQLYGGASRFAWTAESKTISTEVTAKVKAYPGFLFQLFLGGIETDNAGESTGSVGTATNFNGTSCISATTGISGTLALTSSDNAQIKFGKFLIKVVTSTTVDIYMYSDVDIARGASGTAYQSDLLKITATPLTITSATAVAIPTIGLSLTGGSGTIGMTVGDTAVFGSRPMNSASTDFTIGEAATQIPAFGAYFLAQKRADGEMFEIQAYNVIGAGMPMPLDEMAFSITELKMTCLYDSVPDAVFHIRHVIPLTFN